MAKNPMFRNGNRRVIKKNIYNDELFSCRNCFSLGILTEEKNLELDSVENQIRFDLSEFDLLVASGMVCDRCSPIIN